MNITYRALTAKQLKRAIRVRKQSFITFLGVGAALGILLYWYGLPYGIRPAGWPWAPADWYGVQMGTLLASMLVAGACLAFAQKLLHIDVLVRRQSGRIIMFAVAMTVLSLTLALAGGIILVRLGQVSWTASNEGWRPGLWVWSTPPSNNDPIIRVGFSDDSQAMHAWLKSGAERTWLIGRGQEQNAPNVAWAGPVSLSSAEFIQQDKRLKSAGAELAVAGSHDLKLRLKDGKELTLTTDQIGSVTCLALSAKGDRVLAGSKDGIVRVWNSAFPKEPKLLKEKNDKDTSPVSVVVLTPNEQIAVSGHENGMIRLWNLKTGNKLYDLKQHTSPVIILAFDSTGRKFCSMAAQSNVLCFWNVDSDKLIAPFESPIAAATHLALSSDGRYVLIVADASIHVLRLTGL